MSRKDVGEWHVKLKVSIEEKRQIKREAIDRDMKVSEYIKLKLLTNPPLSVNNRVS